MIRRAAPLAGSMALAALLAGCPATRKVGPARPPAPRQASNHAAAAKPAPTPEPKAVVRPASPAAPAPKSDFPTDDQGNFVSVPVEIDDPSAYGLSEEQLALADPAKPAPSGGSYDPFADPAAKSGGNGTAPADDPFLAPGATPIERARPDESAGAYDPFRGAAPAGDAASAANAARDTDWIPEITVERVEPAAEDAAVTFAPAGGETSAVEPIGRPEDPFAPSPRPEPVEAASTAPASTGEAPALAEGDAMSIEEQREALAQFEASLAERASAEADVPQVELASEASPSEAAANSEALVAMEGGGDAARTDHGGAEEASAELEIEGANAAPATEAEVAVEPGGALLAMEDGDAKSGAPIPNDADLDAELAEALAGLEAAVEVTGGAAVVELAEADRVVEPTGDEATWQAENATEEKPARTELPDGNAPELVATESAVPAVAPPPTLDDRTTPQQVADSPETSPEAPTTATIEPPAAEELASDPPPQAVASPTPSPGTPKVEVDPSLFYDDDPTESKVTTEHVVVDARPMVVDDPNAPSETWESPEDPGFPDGFVESVLGTKVDANGVPIVEPARGGEADANLAMNDTMTAGDPGFEESFEWAIDPMRPDTAVLERRYPDASGWLEASLSIGDAGRSAHIAIEWLPAEPGADNHSTALLESTSDASFRVRIPDGTRGAAFRLAWVPAPAGAGKPFPTPPVVNIAVSGGAVSTE